MIVKIKYFVFILILIIGFIPSNYNESYADRRDWKSKSTKNWKKRLQKSQKRTRKKIVFTYIDSLNKGAEISLLNERINTNSMMSNKIVPPGKKIMENGYRIQLLASSSAEGIRSQKKAVESKLHVSTYIVFEKPYYKMFAGDFLTREDAERAIGKIKRAGYSDAWIVESAIFIND